MRPINIYIFTQLHKTTDEKLINEYLSHLSHANKKTKIKIHEYNSIVKLVDLLVNEKMELKYFDNFYFGFTIPQISKEFDLLKLGDNSVLNIELKSEFTSEDSIKHQLVKNKYYLSHLGLEVYLYTLIANTSKIYTLSSENELIEAPIDNLIQNLKEIDNAYADDLNIKFKVSDFLVNPINQPNLFIKREYFLTSLQESIKKDILKSIKKGIGIHKITGGAGTGKTLLLYDIAFEALEYGRVLIIHGGNLSVGHGTIKYYTKLIIEPIKYASIISYDEYDFIFIDEAQRIRKDYFEEIMVYYNREKQVLVFSLDERQMLSFSEIEANISKQIDNIKDIKNHTLTNTIRTNQEVLRFITSLYNLNVKYKFKNTQNVKILYASHISEAESIKNLYELNGYKFISYTPSMYTRARWNRFGTRLSSHNVLGQEFNKVITIMGSEFHYNDLKVLESVNHPNPDYIYTGLLYQQLTRAKEDLCIIIYENIELFKSIMSIFN